MFQVFSHDFIHASTCFFLFSIKYLDMHYVSCLSYAPFTHMRLLSHVSPYDYNYNMIFTCFTSYDLYTLFLESAPLSFDPILVGPDRVWIW